MQGKESSVSDKRRFNVKFRDTLSLKDPFEKNEEAISQTEESKSGGSSIGVDQVIVGG